jgi:hypothetical protein
MKSGVCTIQLDVLIFVEQKILDVPIEFLDSNEKWGLYNPTNVFIEFLRIKENKQGYL